MYDLTPIGPRMHTADTSSRVAGAALAVVGLLNIVVGVLALTTDLVRLSAGAAGGSLAVGVALAAIGALVWRGSRAATIGAFAVVLALLLLQIGQVVADAGDPVAAAASGDQPVARLVVLAALTVVLAVAAWRRRHPASRAEHTPEAVTAGR